MAFLGKRIAGEHIDGKLVGAVFQPGLPDDLIDRFIEVCKSVLGLVECDPEDHENAE